MASPGRLTLSSLGYFDLSIDGFPWKELCRQQIERRRASLQDLLLFDILLRSGGVGEPDTIYPPADVETFHRLLEAIQESTYDALKQNCLVYFLLKWYNDGREDKFSKEKCIPPHFAALSDAYWHLDAGMDVPRAVSILADARLNTDYASKILQAISLAPESMPLVLKYVRTAKPLLTEPDDIDMYTVALAETSLLEAWRFQRTFSEGNETRERLVKKILHWCFNPSPRRNALVQLLGIALTSYEQNLIQKYAIESPSDLPPASIAKLQNLLCVRLIQAGKYSDAIKLDRQFSSTSSTTHALQAERTKMVQDVYAALPLAERAILDLELENPGMATTMGADSFTSVGASAGRELDMNMSWEDIRAPVLPATTVPDLSSSFKSGFQKRSSFGGLGVAPQTPSAFPSLAFNSSSSAQSFAAPSNSPRTSFGGQAPSPFVHQPVNTVPATTAFSSLSHSTGRRSFGSSNALSNAGQKPLFESANRKPNAFYQPPVAPPPPSVPLSHDTSASAGASGINPSENGDADVEMDEGDKPVSEIGREEEELVDEEEGLGYSVFGSKTTHSSKRPTTSSRTRQSATEAKRIPPGAFVTDDDPEPEGGDSPAPAPPPSRQTRRSAAAKSGAPQSEKLTKGTVTRTRARAKEQELSRSLPGSLLNSEGSGDDEEDEEVGDHLGPLPRRQEAATKGAQTRRRSSRLSSVSDIESKDQKEKATGKTRTTTGAGRKRRA